MIGFLPFLLLAGQATAGAATTEQIEVSASTSVIQGDQIPTSATFDPAETIGVENIDGQGKASVGMEQVTGQLVARMVASGTTESNPPLSEPQILHLKVSGAWRLVRSRGQQPTPELMAQEVGSEQLARFLSIFPGSEKIFGPGSNEFPVADPR